MIILCLFFSTAKAQLSVGTYISDSIGVYNVNEFGYTDVVEVASSSLIEVTEDKIIINNSEFGAEAMYIWRFMESQENETKHIYSVFGYDDMIIVDNKFDSIRIYHAYSDEIEMYTKILSFKKVSKSSKRH